MGLRGPKEKPRELKIIEGVTNKRRIPDSIMEPDPTVPVRPSWLTGYAKTIWERLAPKLGECGVLKYTDRNALAAYCCLVAAFRDAFRADDVANIVKLAPQIRAAGAEFGLTPSSRSNIHVDSGRKPDGDGKKAARLLG